MFWDLRFISIVVFLIAVHHVNILYFVLVIFFWVSGMYWYLFSMQPILKSRYVWLVSNTLSSFVSWCYHEQTRSGLIISSLCRNSWFWGWGRVWDEGNGGGRGNVLRVILTFKGDIYIVWMYDFIVCNGYILCVYTMCLFKGKYRGK